MSFYEVKIEAAFQASHAVPLADGKMEEPHTHQWNVCAAFRADKLSEPMGVVVDFVEVQNALVKIISGFENRDLNKIDFFTDKTTSAERAAEYIAMLLKQSVSVPHLLYSVTVSEAPGCSAGYYPD